MTKTKIPKHAMYLYVATSDKLPSYSWCSYVAIACYVTTRMHQYNFNCMHITKDDTDIRVSSPPPLLPEDVMMCELDVTHDHILIPVSMTTLGKLYQPAT